MKKSTLLCGILILSGCGGSGGSSSNSTPVVTPTFIPATEGSYDGVPYSKLGNPPGFSNYPGGYFPTFANHQSSALSKIAYGYNTNPAATALSAYVLMGNYICSATPVHYNPQLNSTFLIGAAHCFVANKTSPTSLTPNNLLPLKQLSVSNGFGTNGNWNATYPVQAVYLMQNYCYASTFNEMSGCPNFVPSSVYGGQSNDLAVIQISGKYANLASFPQVVPASEYPDPQTNAPVLSLGYGINTQTPNANDAGLARSTLFYVANYFYQYSNFGSDSGYNYLYNSYYTAGAFGQSGYTASICGGDSGGGDLFWTGEKWILLAEHSYGPANACGTFYSYPPNAAINVSAYYDWIQEIINDSSAAGPIQDCQNSVLANCVTNGG